MGFFSATWPKEVESFACKLCNDSVVVIRIGREGVSAGHGDKMLANKNIHQEVVVVDFPEYGSTPWDKQDEEKRKFF